MANTALSPEILRALGVLSPGNSYTDPATGMSYSGQYDWQGGGEGGSYGPLQNYNAVDPTHANVGDPYSIYNPNGSYSHSHQIEPDRSGRDFLTALAGGAAIFGLGPMLSGAGSGAGAAGAGYGGASAAENAYLNSALQGSGAAGGGIGAAGGAGSAVGAAGGAGGASAGIGSAAGAAGGAGALSGLGGAGSALGAVGSFLGSNPGLIGAALGALGGATGRAPTTTDQKKIDPRMEPYIYGENGALERARRLYEANPTGINSTMRAGMDRQLALINDPATAQGFQNIANRGQGLLNRGVSANPFTAGTMGQFGNGLLGRYLSGGLLGR